MIRSFRDNETELLFNDQFSKRFQSIERTARRKLYQLHQATSLKDLSAIPVNRLEALTASATAFTAFASMTSFAFAFDGWTRMLSTKEIVDYH